MKLNKEQETYIEEKLNALSKSKFRSSFHLRNYMIDMIKEKGMDTIEKHCIDFIEKNLFRITSEKYEKEDDDSVVLFCASSVSEEVHQAGLEIRRLLAENKDLQFRDIAFVSGDIEGYAPYIESEFQKMGIPYYIDRTSGIKLNPMVDVVYEYTDASGETVTETVQEVFYGAYNELAEK